MPFDVRVDVERRIVMSRFWGVFTDGDLADHRAAILSDADFDPAYNQLIDGTDVTEVRLAASTVTALSISDPFQTGSRRALVSDNDTGYGFMRMYQSLVVRPGLEMRVFRSLDDALQWLAIPTNSH